MVLFWDETVRLFKNRVSDRDWSILTCEEELFHIYHLVRHQQREYSHTVYGSLSVDLTLVP